MAALGENKDELAFAPTEPSPALTPPASGAEPALPFGRGVKVGRYLVLDLLGAGGMGFVYAAHDPELDRKVALKVLRSDRNAAGPDLRSRLVREAQAMARLSHPNVIAVYDGGTVGDQVFVAMELVEGQTLASWLREQVRTVREVLAVFVRAGRGLAAAHAAGIVHRDFKPDNVLLGRDGRVRVSDFGLARPTSPQPESPAAAPSGMLASASAHAGTPGYMAPEQYAGAKADARTDQFSFCVALYEALYGQRPFVAPSVPELASAVLAGRVAEPPAGSRVPGWLRRVVVRGLSVDPDARYPSMERLLEALARDPRRRIRQGLVVAGALVLAGAFGVRLSLHHARPRCSAASIWSSQRWRAIEQAFAETHRPYAGAAATAANQLLEQYARRWSAARAQACEATWVRGEQSEELLDLRMQCLERRREELDQLLTLLARPDAELVDKAIDAAHALTSLESCSDPVALKSRVPPPRNAKARAQIEALGQTLAKARAQSDALKFADGLALVRSVVPQARELGYRPLEAEALYTLGDLEVKTGDVKAAEATLRQAALAAEAGRDDAAAARTWTDLVYLVGNRQARYAEGHDCARYAVAAIERLGGNGKLSALLWYNEGSVYLEEQKFGQALALYQRALARFEKELGAEHPHVASALDSLAIAYSELGQHERALDYHGRALAAREKTYGPVHPDVAWSHNNIGGVFAALGRREEALASYRRTAEIRKQLLGEEHSDYAEALVNLGAMLIEMGKPEAALTPLRRALAIFIRVLGPEHPRVAACRANLGNALRDLGRLEQAFAETSSALEIFRNNRGENDRDVATALNNLAEILRAQGRLDQAAQFNRRALAVSETIAEPIGAIDALSALAGDRLRLHRPAQAIPLLEKALAMRAEREGEATDLPELRFELARALWQAGQDRPRARKLALEARTEYARVGPKAKRPLVEVEAWLNRHGR